MKTLTYITFILTFLSCKTENTIPKETADFLTEALTLLENRSINRYKIDWEEFRADVFQKAQHAKSITDIYPEITYAITKLNDNHSYFKPVNESEESTENKPLPVLLDEATPEDIGYIRVPFCIGTANQYEHYMSTIRTKIKNQSKKKLKGWIIDLRGNFGGNMWPMLLAIEPLLGNGTFGYFVDADNNHRAWKIFKGKTYIDDELILETNFDEKLDLSKQFLAIITNSHTASSGEAIAIALKWRENSKSFGKPTYGVSTGCVAHQLSDGSVINLAESIFADRKMKKYGLSINPDVEIDENDAIKAGIDWIYEMTETQ